MKKYGLVLLSTLVMCLFVVGCGNKISSYKFTNEQKKFLTSVGIDSIGTMYDCDDGSKAFDYGREKVYVYLDKSSGIKRVCYGDEKDELWSDKFGKIGLIKHSERQAYLDNFVACHDKRYDQSIKTTWIDSIGNCPFGHVGIYTYMGMKDQRKWLRAIIHYSNEKWLFVEKIIFSNKDTNWTYVLPKSPKQDIVWGGVHETCDVAFEDLLQGMKIVAYGENPRIDFVGEKGKYGKWLTSYEANNYRTYLKLQQCVGK